MSFATCEISIPTGISTDIAPYRSVIPAFDAAYTSAADIPAAALSGILFDNWFGICSGN